jgi:hypothetical protein
MNKIIVFIVSFLFVANTLAQKVPGLAEEEQKTLKLALKKFRRN